MRFNPAARLLLLASALTIGLGVQSANRAYAAPSCPGSPQPRLVVGRDAQIVAGESNSLRDQPSQSATVVDEVQENEYVTVIGGPSCAESLSWWIVKYNEKVGWMVEGIGSTYLASPLTSPTTQFEPVAGSGNIEVSYQNVKLVYSGFLSKKVLVNTVFAVKQPERYPVFIAAPEHVEFVFADSFSSVQSASNMPVLAIYPANAYAKLAKFVQYTLDDLRGLLRVDNRPTKSSSSLDQNSVSFPMLPPMNATELFHARVHYIDFADGSVVCFLTQYGQDLAPISNQDLRQMCIGFSRAEKYVIVLRFPVSAKFLPNGYDDATDFQQAMQGEDRSNDKLAKYLTDTIARLDKAAPGDFKPSLTDIDSIFKTLTIK
jgi:hypothetical protein